MDSDRKDNEEATEEEDKILDEKKTIIRTFTQVCCVRVFIPFMLLTMSCPIGIAQ